MGKGIKLKSTKGTVRNVRRKNISRKQMVIEQSNKIQKTESKKSGHKKEKLEERREHLKATRKLNKRNVTQDINIEENDEIIDDEGYYKLPQEFEISERDEHLLEEFEKRAQKADKEGKTLGALIFENMDLNKGKKEENMFEERKEENLDPKVEEVYKKVGELLKKYTSGKLPRPFTVIPTCIRWQELLDLTNPSEWSAHAMEKATKLFSSTLNNQLSQVFYNQILLPAVRENIQKNKRLNYHLYASLKHAIFKPSAFFKGLIFPLVNECTLKEAAIIGSIMAKISIPVLHASVACMKICDLNYSIGSAYFIKILMNKRYAFPIKVINALLSYFLKFKDDQDIELPVLWHQTLLLFIQKYSEHFTLQQRKDIKALLRVKKHYLITPQIKKELNLSKQQKKMEA